MVEGTFAFTSFSDGRIDGRWGLNADVEERGNKMASRRSICPRKAISRDRNQWRRGLGGRMTTLGKQKTAGERVKIPETPGAPVLVDSRTRAQQQALQLPHPELR